MPTIDLRFDASTGPGTAPAAAEIQRVMRGALKLLDRLVPPRHAVRDAEPPPEFYKYPPV